MFFRNATINSNHRRCSMDDGKRMTYCASLGMIVLLVVVITGVLLFVKPAEKKATAGTENQKNMTKTKLSENGAKK